MFKYTNISRVTYLAWDSVIWSRRSIKLGHAICNYFQFREILKLNLWQCLPFWTFKSKDTMRIPQHITCPILGKVLYIIKVATFHRRVNRIKCNTKIDTEHFTK